DALLPGGADRAGGTTGAALGVRQARHARGAAAAAGSARGHARGAAHVRLPCTAAGLGVRAAAAVDGIAARVGERPAVVGSGTAGGRRAGADVGRAAAAAGLSRPGAGAAEEQP